MNSKKERGGEEESDLGFMDQFRYIHGRRYHNVENTSYFLPNDNEEADRLCMQHYVIRHDWKGNFLSPVEERLISGHANVLDVGCGSGEWVLDVSSVYPLSTFVGVDISNMWKNLEGIPPNAGFLVHNLVQGVPFPEETMDFIHVRLMGLSFSEPDWMGLVNELIRVCKSGGWIEIVDVDYVPTNMGPATKLLSNALMKFHKSKGCYVPSLKDFERYLKQNDQITDIRIVKKIVPLGNWGENFGRVVLLGFNHFFKAFKTFLAPSMNLNDEKYDQLLKEHEHQVNEYKTDFEAFRIYGMKI